MLGGSSTSLYGVIHRFTVTDDGEDPFMVYIFAEAKDADSNGVGLTVNSTS